MPAPLQSLIAATLDDDHAKAAAALHYASDGWLENPSWDPGPQVAMIRLLLCIDAQDKNGATPRHRAVRTRCADAVKCSECRCQSRDQKQTRLHTVSSAGAKHGPRRLRLGEGARTAQREILHAFLEHGVSPAHTDAKGKSVLQWAVSDWIRQILQGTPLPPAAAWPLQPPKLPQSRVCRKNRRSSSPRRIFSRRFPRAITWQNALGYSIRMLRAIPPPLAVGSGVVDWPSRVSSCPQAPSQIRTCRFPASPPLEGPLRVTAHPTDTIRCGFVDTLSMP